MGDYSFSSKKLEIPSRKRSKISAITAIPKTINKRMDSMYQNRPGLECIAVFLFKAAALEMVRRISKAKCPVFWTALQGLQLLCYPPFKWIQRWAPLRVLVMGIQHLSRPLLFLSVATAFSDQSESDRENSDASGDSQPNSEPFSEPVLQQTQDIRSESVCDESPQSLAPENWLIQLYKELEKQNLTLPERINEDELRRFFAAANGVYACFFSSVKKTIRWRETYNILSVHELQSWSHLVFWHGYDVKLRPCLFVRLGLACTSLPFHERPRFTQAIEEELQGSKMELQEIKEMLSKLVPNYRRTATVEEQLVPRDEDDAPSDHSLHSSNSDVDVRDLPAPRQRSHVPFRPHSPTVSSDMEYRIAQWVAAADPHNRSISNPPSPIRGIQTPYHTHGVRERNHSTYSNKNLDFEGEDLRTRHRQVPNLVPPNQIIFSDPVRRGRRPLPSMSVREIETPNWASTDQAQYATSTGPVSQIEQGVLHLVNSEVPQVTVLMDCEGLTPFNFPMQILRSCSSLVQDHYPNRLGCLFIIRLAPVVRVVAQTFIQVLKPVTRQKLRIEGVMYKKVLSEYLQTVPSFLGGDCVCPKCSTPPFGDSETRWSSESSMTQPSGKFPDGKDLSSSADSYIADLQLSNDYDRVLKTAILGIIMLLIFVGFIAGMYGSESPLLPL
ncbi:hypothetical protein IFM89_008819 [Coptis chinensis]|uniref:CRAL-TRIO domain-containing protein n=1 Tax=Coptis chinensis TaxID=261450 RepID=A0A835HG81_9MAGN|nr:hypothetical protein IFM89_008819 [Coptis chinensis]